ncbi:hypothetical protein SmJEL517_g03880 [Synchytrium microbalum]|uniref:non-specific serine/threonine protein kinase n=1 Tax=Synchytrium microbalum TaxID=1806994 RepID=A0A507C1G2_9FUNG|nr:uncharacterized protein SmJEL517_g03880 [Synchytrium microbalum]TPX33261.1 hypothetical protein SmJEL517_g03880 [Synchytrium microbalum]
MAEREQEGGSVPFAKPPSGPRPAFTRSRHSSQTTDSKSSNQLLGEQKQHGSGGVDQNATTSETFTTTAQPNERRRSRNTTQNHDHSNGGSRNQSSMNVDIPSLSMPSLERIRSRPDANDTESAYTSDRPPYIPSSSNNNLGQPNPQQMSKNSSRASSTLSASRIVIAGRKRTLSRGVVSAGGPSQTSVDDDERPVRSRSANQSSSQPTYGIESRSTSALSQGSSLTSTSRLPSTADRPVLHIYPRKQMVGRSQASLATTKPPPANNSNAVSISHISKSVSGSGWTQQSSSGNVENHNSSSHGGSGSNKIHKSRSTIVGSKSTFSVGRSRSMARVNGMTSSRSMALNNRDPTTMGGIMTPFKNRAPSSSSVRPQDESVHSITSGSAPAQTTPIVPTSQHDSKKELSWVAPDRQTEEPESSEATSEDDDDDKYVSEGYANARRPSIIGARTRRLSAASSNSRTHFSGQRRVSTGSAPRRVSTDSNQRRLSSDSGRGVPFQRDENTSPVTPSTAVNEIQPDSLAPPGAVERQISNVSQLGPIDDSYRDNPEYYEYLMLCQRHASSNFITKIGSSEVVYEEEGIVPKMVGPYLLGDQIGKGSFGKVKEGLCSETLQRVAVKIINKKRLRKVQNGVENVIRQVIVMHLHTDELADSNREIKLLRRLKHKNCITLIDVYCKVEDDEGFNSFFPWYQEIEEEPIIWKYDDGTEVEKSAEVLKWYMVFEYCPCSLQMLIEHDGKLTAERARGFFVQLMEGLAYLHSQSIVHRDIKPGNLLITTDGTLKLTDYGIMEEFSPYEAGDLMTTTFAGTHQFLSSEIAAGATIFSGTKVDIWACGVTLYNMVTARYPFEFPLDGTLMGLYQNIIEAEWQTPPEVDAELNDLLRGVLRKDPDTRMTIPEVLDHGWCISGESKFSSRAPPAILAYPVIDDNQTTSRSNTVADDDLSTAYNSSSNNPSPAGNSRPTLRPISEIRDSQTDESHRHSSGTASGNGFASSNGGLTSPKLNSSASDSRSANNSTSGGVRISSDALDDEKSRTHTLLENGGTTTSPSVLSSGAPSSKAEFAKTGHSRAWTGSRGQIVEPTETTLIPYLDILYAAEIEGELDSSGTIGDLLGVEKSKKTKGGVKNWFMGVFKRPPRRKSSRTGIKGR